LIELVVIGATLAFAAGASGAQLHRRILASRSLAAYATSRRHVFVPPPDMPRGSSPRVEGKREGVAFGIDLYKLRDIVRTRVSANVVCGRLPRFEISKGRFVTETPDDAESIRHHAGDALKALRARRGVVLSSDGMRVAFSWEGIETNPLLLDAARDAVCALAMMHAPSSSPYR
jgi:hypothetical protein